MKKATKRLLRGLVAMLLITALMVGVITSVPSACPACGHTGAGGVWWGSHVYQKYDKINHKFWLVCSACGVQDSSWSYGTHACYGGITGYVQATGSYHYAVYAYCDECYETGVYHWESCTKKTTYSSYSSSQHKVVTACSKCGKVFSTSYASHSFSYGSWSQYSDTQHRRAASCSVCGYKGYDYESHSFTYGDWMPTEDGFQQMRTATCSVCGYSTIEYAGHNYTYTDWNVSEDETQHERQCTCTDCGYVSTEYADHADDDEDGSCDSCGYEMSRFSVTVPTSLDLVMAEDGTIFAATSAAIQNDSTAAVEVASVTVGNANGWTLVPALYNMADAHVDSKLISFCVNDCWVSGTGTSEELSLSGDWTIAKGESLSLDYDARISATSVALDEQVLTLTFVVRWNE